VSTEQPELSATPLERATRISANYSRILEEGSAVRDSIASFRAYLGERRDAVKWVAAFSVGGLFAVIQGSDTQTVSGASVVLASAGLCFFLSLSAAFFFHVNDLEAGEFKHETETRIGRLAVELGRANRALDSMKTIAEPDDAQMQLKIGEVHEPVAAAADAVTKLNWPRDVVRAAAYRSLGVCAGGFLAGAGLMLGLALVRLLSVV